MYKILNGVSRACEQSKIISTFENLCETCSTSTEVGKLNTMLSQYISDKGSFSKASTSKVTTSQANNNQDGPTPTSWLAGKMTIEHLCDAAATGDESAVKEILAHGAVDVNGAWNPDEDDYKYGNFHDEWYEHNRTPLHYAMQFNHPAVVSTLLASELTKLDVLDGEGLTPLHLACHGDNADCVKLFVRDSRCNEDMLTPRQRMVTQHSCLQLYLAPWPLCGSWGSWRVRTPGQMLGI
eukprot:TRINITY_DN15960_c0_g1_i1.p1 TRINITY_DN15960_c0_g1~~TRINITY_DN15960_c0_g1_i1.p1  ORF type:complete len:238 (-),score=36.49 TRINITY_DN15960_c0_g1_i1:438-1151(-)